jgi:23S rRNA (uracil1939-C5)-methyltransferase
VEPVELQTERVVAGGDALARMADGRVAFVRGALPGERVVAIVSEEHRDFVRATAGGIIDASPDRVEPPCPYVARGCGGCNWQHVAPAAQPLLKRTIIEDALRRIGRLTEPSVGLGPPLPSQGFRTSMRTAISPSGRLGFHTAHTHDVVAVDHCLVAHPLVDQVLAETHASGRGDVSIRVSVSSGERTVMAEPAAVRLEGVPRGTTIGPHGRVHEVVMGTTLRVSAQSFFQSRSDGATALVGLVGATLDGAEKLIDAYAGVGLFAATVAPGAEVVAIERSASSAADARRNLRDRAAVVDECDVASWEPVPADAVVADPSRRGLGPRAAAALAATGAPRLVLVSCDAASLGRDTALLGGLGYHHRATTVVDLFPHTSHVECVSEFRRE